MPFSEVVALIYVYTGTVGSGKSYHALRTGLDYISRGRWVLANFPVKSYPQRRFFKRFERALSERWIYRESVTPADLVRLAVEHGWHGRESQCLLIFDEAGVLFNSRDWNIKGHERKEWIKFFSQSRKLGYDVILIAQDIRYIDRQIRSLAEYEVKHRDLRKYMWFKYLPIRLFAAVYFWTGGSFRGSVRFVPFSKRIASRYDTFKMFDLDLEAFRARQGRECGASEASAKP